MKVACGHCQGPWELFSFLSSPIYLNVSLLLSCLVQLYHHKHTAEYFPISAFHCIVNYIDPEHELDAVYVCEQEPEECRKQGSIEGRGYSPR